MKTPILELRTLANTGHFYEGSENPVKDGDDYLTNHHPKFLEWLAKHGWEEDDYRHALIESFDKDGYWTGTQFEIKS